jgi:cystathionine gamma-lyase
MKKKVSKKNTQHFNTRVIHMGGEPDPVTGSIMPPIHQTSTYVQIEPGKHLGYEYTRSHNPTRTRLETCLASLESANHCVVTARRDVSSHSSHACSSIS